MFFQDDSVENELEQKKTDLKVYSQESMVIVQVRDDEVMDEDNNRNNGEEGDSELLLDRTNGTSGLIQCGG